METWMPITPSSTRFELPQAEFRDARRRAFSPFAVILVLVFVLDGTAWAIPSPDVMVNLFASAAQVLGLVSLILGRWFFVNRGRSGGATRDGGSFRVPFFAAAGLCLVTSAGWYLYHASVRDSQLERLQVNLNRNSKEEGKKIVDVSLKELSFSDQLKRDDGISTEELSKMLASGKELQILDVRESEEREVGGIHGTRHVRFPDLLAEPEKYMDRGRGVTLLCFNGNRSSELAKHFEELGYTCRFMIGGYEKWLAEDRPLDMQQNFARGDLRLIPDYPNKDELLDTPDVMKLLEERNPIFVDVRYPGDFDQLGHLPGAINITMRKLTTAELDAALNALPKRPVIVPCYDKRSSFFGLVLGLRLSRMGYEFLGRYTTPEGFAAPAKDKPHIAAWKAAHEPKSLLTMAATPLQGALTWLEDKLGALALSILALVLAIRLLILPLTLKAERDRRVQNDLAPAVAALRTRHAGDPASLSKATMRLYDENRIRPFWNLTATVAQLLLFTVFFTVVQQAARGSTEGFLWIDDLGAPDATRILPLAIAALLGAQIVVSMKTRTPLKLALCGVAMLALGALVWNLSSAVGLYLAANLTLLVAQTLLVGLWFARRRTAEARHTQKILARYAHKNIVPLQYAHIVPGCGGKAARLGHLMAAGMPVPGGFVVRAAAVEARRRTTHFAADDSAAILAAHRALKAERVAVRSSGLNEDGALKSYAGVFESILDVRHESLFEALEKVADSLGAARVGAYSEGDETGAIVVQAMVPASWAGVLFTEHPGESGACAVEMIEGLGDALVSGRAQPVGFRLGRLTGRVLGLKQPPMDLAPLFALGVKLEALFERPQDIEWAFADGKFHLLQARDITRLSRSGSDERAILESERRKLLDLARGENGDRGAPAAQADDIVLAQNELSELLPNPTPFSLAFMDSLWAHGGSTHRACNSLGIPYDVDPDSAPYAVSVFGALYVNRREEQRRMSRAPSSLTSFRLSRAADSLERAWREEFLPAELAQSRLREVLDLSRLCLDELVGLFGERRHDFVTRSYVRAEEINIAADFYLKGALRALEKKGLDPALLLAHIPPTIVHEAMELLTRVGRKEIEAARFLEVFGHRAPLDYELAEPRYSEDLARVETLAVRAAAAGGHVSTAEAPSIPAGRVLALTIERARRYQALKEEAKHHALRELAFLRALLVELGARLSLGDGIFMLTPDEILRTSDAGFRMNEMCALVLRRGEERECMASITLPAQITLAQLEELDVEHGGTIPHAMPKDSLAGTRVSGSGGVVGRARVLRTPEDIATFKKGEILVARFTDPTWMSVFPLAKGIVTEVGGWLSHAAIQAREYGITGIVGTHGALDAFQTGDLVLLGADGTVKRLDERRSEARLPADVHVTVRRSIGPASGQLHDLSSRGALLVVANAKLEIGEHVGLEIAGRDDVAARVIRNGVPGIYGLELSRPLR
jgi:rifampicin phosphotransferase